MKKSKKSAPAKYERTADEVAAIQSLAGSTSVKVLNSGTGPQLVPNHPDEAVGHALLAQALGTTDLGFMYPLINQLVSAASTGSEINESGINFMLSVIKGIGPKDQLEAMLAAQMAAVQMATMTFARRLAGVQNIDQQDSAERAFNKLARTYVMQMEALKRYRTGGEQKMTVQHVTVSEGGQAIVGNVTQTSSKHASKPAPPALTDARTEPMPILSERAKVPVPARSGRKK